MANQLTRASCLLFSLAVFLACTQGVTREKLNWLSSSQTPPSEHGKQLAQQTGEFGRTVMKGVGAGALAGAIFGGVTGGNWKSAAKGAVAGAVVGGVAGYYIAGKEQRFTDQAAALDAISADLRQQNAELDAMVATADNMLLEDQRRVAALRLQVTSAEIRQREQIALASQVEADRKVLAKAIETAQARLDVTSNNVAKYEKDYGGQAGQSFGPLLTAFENRQASLRATQDQVSALVTELRSRNGAG